MTAHVLLSSISLSWYFVENIMWLIPRSVVKQSPTKQNTDRFEQVKFDQSHVVDQKSYSGVITQINAFYQDIFSLLATRVSYPERLTKAYTMQQCFSILSTIFHSKM